MIVLYIILAALAALLAVILTRTARFKPPSEEPRQAEPVTFDEEAAIRALGELVKCRTVSNADHALEDENEFEKLIGLLPGLYPHVFEVCTMERLPDRALLFTWKGKAPGNPAVLMAHYDVVPVEPENWQRDPFGAQIVDGVMWGRGTLDTKVTFNGILSAADNLIAAGFTPEHDIYFAFSGQEEINGMGAVRIVERFIDMGIVPELVLDEGGAVVEDVFPGVKEPCGLIGIAEKGILNLEYSVSSDGGHASAPKPHTPVGKLAMACAAVEGHPFRYHITRPAAEMFDVLGRRSSFVYRMVFANLWCFAPVLDLISRKSGGEINALLRTTVAFTQMQGSPAPNVIPPNASMVSNIRLNPEDTVAGAVEYIRGVIGDKDVKLTVADHTEPSPVSRTDCEGWRRVSRAVADTWKGCIVSPYLMVACSDSRHYRDLSDRVYRFSAADMTKEERDTIHGSNERIRLETVRRAVEFFIRVMKQC